MHSLQARSSLDISHGLSRGLHFRRLRQPTPLPTLTRRFEADSLTDRLLGALKLRRR